QEPALVEEVAGNTDTVDEQVVAEQVAEAIATPQESATPPASQASQPNGAETSLDQVLQAAGMQLIETSSTPAPTTPSSSVKLGRARKSVTTVAAEPLQQVETD